MAQFMNPFPGVVPGKKLTNEELVRSIRQNHAAELEAVHVYTAIADATDNPIAQKMLREVADDEKTHAGIFMRLTEMFTGDEGKFLLQGANEVEDKTKGIPREGWVSPNFNPLDPLGIMDMVSRDVNRILEATRR
jgi:rubrerythrin